MKALFKEEINPLQLAEMFENDEKCLEFLVELKWHSRFECRKCGNANYCEGKEPFSRAARNVNLRKQLPMGLFFIILSFQSARPFILPIKFARGTKIYQPMNLLIGCHYDN